MEGPDEESRAAMVRQLSLLFSGIGADKRHPPMAGKHSECGALGRASGKAQCFGLEDTQS
jgi:hypothetical protein